MARIKMLSGSSDPYVSEAPLLFFLPFVSYRADMWKYSIFHAGKKNHWVFQAFG
jgi:hypothetical protein